MKPVLEVRFFRTDAGAEPVRDWLKELPATERKAVGEDIKTVSNRPRRNPTSILQRIG